MHYLAICVAGLFVFNENDKLIKFKLFDKNPEEIAKKLDLFERGENFSELEEIKKEFKDLEIKQPNQATEYLKENFRDIILKSKFVNKDSELNEILNSVYSTKSKLNISTIKRRDKLIVQSVSALSDLEKILNTMTERLREWYGLHYPEIIIRDHEKFAETVAKYGERNNFEGFEKSMGMELKKEDIEMLQHYAKELKEMYALEKSVEKYIEKIVPEEMHNLNALLGSVLAARLLALAGSLERLAKMPSSTIQLLGSEKSLFRFLKDKKKGKPPRFGLLFLHPDISNTKKELQGRVARLLSSKLAIAARADFYTKKDMSKELVEDYKKKLKEILAST